MVMGMRKMSVIANNKSTLALNEKNPRRASLSIKPIMVLSLFICALFLQACGGAPDGSTSVPERVRSGQTTAGSTASTGDGDGSIKIGNGTGIGFVAGVLGASSTSLAAGASTTIVANLVDTNNSPILDGGNVTFSSDCIAEGIAAFDEEDAIVSLSSGRAEIEYTAQGCSGTDTVTATFQVSDGVQISASVTLTIAADEVLSVLFVSSVPTQLSTRGIGGAETAEITFRLVGEQSAPIIGETVNFTLSSSVGGIALADTSAVSDNNGEIRTVLQTGTVSASVSVIATHVGTGIQGTSASISIAGSVPISDAFSLSLSQFNPPDASSSDGVAVTLSIIASDQFGNGVPDGTRVSFVSPESGSVENSCELASGRCSVQWISSSPRPADLRATVMAYAEGAEEFTDVNSNNVFDSSDSAFVDLPEACVDANENGACDNTSGEFFVDFNENGSRDAADGVWNGPCLSGVSDVALCPGAEKIVISKSAVIIMSTDVARIIELGDFPPPGSDINVADELVSLSGMLISDSNTAADALGSNPMANGTTIRFTVDGVELVGNTSFTVPSNAIRPTGPHGVTLDRGSNPQNGSLTLTITPPGKSPTEFIWPVVINDTGTGGPDGAQMGNGTGSSFVPNVLAASSVSLDAGGTSSISVNIVDEDNDPISDAASVSFSSNCVTAGLASFDNDTVTTVAGSASVVYTAEGCVGSDTITASAVVGPESLSASVDLTVAADEVLAVEFTSNDPNQISLSGIGGVETSRVTFKLTGAQGAPIIGETVNFALSSTIGGISLATGTESAISDNDGEVSTVIQSGTVSTSVSVIATHTASGIRGESDDIVISTGIPVQSRFSLALSEFNPELAFNTNAIGVTLNIIASDQFGNDAPDGTRIFFASPESGNVDSSCELISGRCSATWISSSPRPANMRATIIAYTNGAEDFTDVNGNNIFDISDTFPDPTGNPPALDLAEACVDEDEDGTCEPGSGEFFVDFNENGTRDAADGVWNGPCLNSVDSDALCPGAQTITIFETATITMPFNTARIFSSGDFPAVGGTIDVSGGVTVLSGLVISDTNTVADPLGGNPMPAGTTFAFATTNGRIANSPNSTVLDNITSPITASNVILEPDSTSSTGTLTLTVTTPSGIKSEFFWIVQD